MKTIDEFTSYHEELLEGTYDCMDPESDISRFGSVAILRLGRR